MRSVNKPKEVGKSGIQGILHKQYAYTVYAIYQLIYVVWYSGRTELIAYMMQPIDQLDLLCNSATIYMFKEYFNTNTV